jgi:hypothetical protein
MIRVNFRLGVFLDDSSVGLGGAVCAAASRLVEGVRFSILRS